MLHRRENLILEDFWMRPGKAYCEDVLHSHLLRQRGIRLFVDTFARCELEVVWKEGATFYAFLIDLYNEYSARKYFMNRVSGVSLQMYLFFALRFGSYIWSALRWKR